MYRHNYLFINIINKVKSSKTPEADLVRFDVTNILKLATGDLIKIVPCCVVIQAKKGCQISRLDDAFNS